MRMSIKKTIYEKNPGPPGPGIEDIVDIVFYRLG